MSEAWADAVRGKDFELDVYEFKSMPENTSTTSVV